MQREAAALRVRAALATLAVLPSDEAEQRALTDKLVDFVALLARWNRAYNLTAVRDPDAMLVQHVFDSAAIAPVLRARLEAKAGAHPRRRRPRVVDVGSGGGLPGVVLAVLWPDVDFLLVEPVGKKAAFLRQVAAELALTNVEVCQQRVEALPLPAAGEGPDAIVCRAFASLGDYARAIAPLVQAHTVVAAMKAAVRDEEASGLDQGWSIEAVLPVEVPELDARRTLVLLQHERDATQTKPAANAEGEGR